MLNLKDADHLPKLEAAPTTMPSERVTDFGLTDRALLEHSLTIIRAVFFLGVAQYGVGAFWAEVKPDFFHANF